jgi:hypothetical protein
VPPITPVKELGFDETTGLEFVDIEFQRFARAGDGGERAVALEFMVVASKLAPERRTRSETV